MIQCPECDAKLGVGYAEGDTCSLCVEADARCRRQQACTHGLTFDAVGARGLTESEVRTRWPRRRFASHEPCGECGYVGISYASVAHYIAGGW